MERPRNIRVGQWLRFQSRGAILICVAIALLVAGLPVAAHSVQLTASSGTTLYSTGHSHSTPPLFCGTHIWSQLNRDSVTKLSSTSLRFNRFEIYTYNVTGTVKGGTYTIYYKNSSGSWRTWQNAQLFGVTLFPNFTYVIYSNITGYHINISSPMYDRFYVAGGGDPGSDLCTFYDQILFIT